MENIKEIIIKDVSKTYVSKDSENNVLHNINIEVYKNEFLVILGAGQTGKTVLLNILADLEQPSSGTVEYTKGKPKMGEIGYVFQKYALFPWKTVMGNVETSPKLKGVAKEERQRNSQKYIDLVGLSGFESAYPKQLSGGMKQRVAIARAYASESDIMLLDEPFGALDAQTRYLMQEEILKIWEQEKRTVIFVTNNIEEALYLGDRLILLGENPTSVKREYQIDLPRPRKLTDPDFLNLRNEIVDQMDLNF